MTIQQKQAIQELQTWHHNYSEKAEKGEATAVMNEEQHITEVDGRKSVTQHQLQTLHVNPGKRWTLLFRKHLMKD